MEAAKEFIKSIVVYMILISVVFHCLPDTRYKKYVKMFAGMLLIILLLTPILSLFQKNDLLDQTFFRKNYEEALKESRGSLQIYEDVQKEKIIQVYQNEINAYIKTLAEQRGLYVLRSDITIEEDTESEDFGSIKEMDLMLSSGQEDAGEIKKITILPEEKTESMDEITMKEQICELYSIPKEQIHLTIDR